MIEFFYCFQIIYLILIVFVHITQSSQFFFNFLLFSSFDAWVRSSVICKTSKFQHTVCCVLDALRYEEHPNFVKCTSAKFRLRSALTLCTHSSQSKVKPLHPVNGVQKIISIPAHDYEQVQKHQSETKPLLFFKQIVLYFV